MSHRKVTGFIEGVYYNTFVALASINVTMNGYFRSLGLVCLLVSLSFAVKAQCSFASPDCQASMSNGTSSNFNALTWTHNSGPACPTGVSSSYGGNLKVSMANNTNLTISANFTVNGDFNLVNSGSNATLTIPVGVTLHVTGDLGDCTNNNVNFVVNGSLVVDGYVSGKNSNSFAGSGSITATGGLFFNNPPTCTSCGITWNVGSCVPTGSAFCTLPINLLFFTAEVRPTGIHIRWATATEQEVDRFVIERSADGIVFSTVADIAGHGTSTQRNDYLIVDERPLNGNAYYRLGEKNFNGDLRYHRIVNTDYKGGRRLDVYPNPVTNGRLNVQPNFSTGREVRVMISDVTGVVLQDVILREGEPLTVDPRLRAGMYILTYFNDDFRVVKRIVIQ